METMSATADDGPTKTQVPAEPVMTDDDTWVASMLSVDGLWTEAITRMVGAVGLAALYGIALGTREGGLALATHPLGVAAAFVAVLALGVPALFIVLALFDLPIDGAQMARCAGRGAAAAGITLAGIAPLVALFVVSSESEVVAGAIAATGLGLAGLVGVHHLHRAWSDMLGATEGGPPIPAGAAFSVFVLFSGVLAGRIWLSTLPILGGAW